MDKPSIKDLFQISSLPAAVIGGGSSAPSDYAKLPPNCLIISANHHAYMLGLRPDYFVFNDDPQTRPFIMERLKNPQGATVISSRYQQYSDYRIDVPNFNRGFTGQFCAWLGCWITSGAVYLCGFDLYSSDQHYFHGVNNEGERGAEYSVDHHLERWELALGKNPKEKGCYMPERINAVSGLLTNIFKHEHN